MGAKSKQGSFLPRPNLPYAADNCVNLRIMPADLGVFCDFVEGWAYEEVVQGLHENGDQGYETWEEDGGGETEC